jgi:hypothetical protein
MHIRMRNWMTRTLLGLTCGVLSWAVSPAARADDVAPKQNAAEVANDDNTEAAKDAGTPKKQWVWLTKQNCWGYGYKRDDGLWVIDPGSKRKAAAEPEAAWFVNWLNRQRAAVGLPAVGHDPNLTHWAAVNNAQQQSRGMGHFVMGPARRQNAAVGSAGSVGQQWMNSPAHRAALLDPSIRWIGIAGLGAYWTFNAR